MFFVLFFTVYLFVLRERDREPARDGQRERETENPKEAVSTEPNIGLELTNHEIIT